MLHCFCKQGIVFSFFALEYEVERLNNLPLNAVKPNFVAIYMIVCIFLTATLFIKIISF